jgi:Tol biopolymer transport system component
MKSLALWTARALGCLIVLGLAVGAGSFTGQGQTLKRDQHQPKDDARDKDKEKEKAKEQKDQPRKKVEGLPLKPDRTVEFNTDEGTWVSLDISPDGKTILFELLGDLYTVPIAGGEAKAVTSGIAFDAQPRYSPDGKLIAFVSDRDGAENLWVAAADGRDARPLTKDKQSLFASPAWTPDGDYVLASRQPQLPWGGFELWMYHLRGGSGVQVTKGKLKPDARDDDYVHAIGAVASRDGKYLFYTKRPKLFNAYNNLEFPLSQVVRRDRTTGDEDTITSAQGSAFRPIVAPDGSKLVYGTRIDNQTGLRVRDMQSGEERWLKLPVQRDEQESRFTRDLIPGYAFTPDGKQVVAAYGGKIHRLDVQTGRDEVIPFSVRVSQPVGSRLNFPIRVDDGPVRARLIQDPKPSPDAKRLAFSSLTHLYVMDLPDGKPRQLSAAEAREFQPSWSPDGKWLAYVSWSPEGGHIWKRSLEGQVGEPERITRVPAFYRDPVWSPDGKRIVALRAPRREKAESPYDFGASTNTDLLWVPMEGGEATLISPARGASRPHFAKEPERIYLTTPHGLISMRFDGTDRRTHLQVTGTTAYRPTEPEPADEILLRPDARWALASLTKQLYLVALPQYGGEAPKTSIHGPTLPLVKLTDIGADYAAWADGGKTITWAIGSSFFRLPFDSITFETLKPGEEEKPKEGPEAPKKAPIPRSEEIAVVVERFRHRPRGSILLRGAQVVTMRGDEVIPAADVLVTDHRIASVGPKGSAQPPEGAKVLDLAGTTVVPGLVDTHAHWMEIRRGVLDLQNWSFFANLAYGVTTGRDPQTGTNDMFAYQDLVETGDLVGPRAYSTGPGVFSDTDFQSAEEVDGVVARYKKYYRTNVLKSYMIGNRRQRQWMIEACHKNEVMPTTEGGLDLKLNLTHALDGFSGNEHSLPVVPLFRDVVELFARTGISYTPTLLVAYGGPFGETDFFTTQSIHDDSKIRRFIPHEVLDAKVRRSAWFHKDEHVYPLNAASAAKIARAGGHVCIGSHGEMQGIGYHWEMWALSSGGWKPMEVLRAATLHGAEAIGYAQDLGSLETGKLADLVVLAKNPLEDIHNTTSIRYVMKNGELYEGETLDRIWPERKPLPRLWWWDEKPRARAEGS